QVSAGARASPYWIGGRRRPTRSELWVHGADAQIALGRASVSERFEKLKFAGWQLVRVNSLGGEDVHETAATQRNIVGERPVVAGAAKPCVADVAGEEISSWDSCRMPQAPFSNVVRVGLRRPVARLSAQGDGGKREGRKKRQELADPST